MASEIRHLDFNPERTIGFEMISIDHDTATTRKNLSVPHRASFYCIIWFKEGTVIHQVDFIPIHICAKSFLFIGQDAVQFFDQQNSFDAEVLIFTHDFFCQHKSDHAFLKGLSVFNPFAHNIRPVSMMMSKALETLWSQMQWEFQTVEPLFKMELLKNFLHNFLLVAERNNQGAEAFAIQPDNQMRYVLLFMDLLELYFKAHQPVSFYADKISITNKVLNNAIK